MGPNCHEDTTQLEAITPKHNAQRQPKLLKYTFLSWPTYKHYKT